MYVAVETPTHPQTQALGNMHALLTSLHNHTTPMHTAITHIAATPLLPPSPPSPSPTTLPTLIAKITQHLTAIVPQLQQAWQGIATQLKAIEMLLLGTESGRAESLAVLYRHWEKQVYEALVHMVVQGRVAVCV